jgi:hypothetical protein
MYGTNCHAVRIFDDFDEQITFGVPSPSPFRPRFIARGARRLNLPILIDYLERLPGLQVSLPVKVVLGVHRTLLALSPCRGSAQC